VPTPREFLEEENREHLVEHDDGKFRFRYCQAAVVSMYGELCTPPPAPETLRMPTLLVHAGQFGLVREEQLQEYERALAGHIQVVEVPGGHIVYWDAFDETADAVTRFLEDARAEA
jgi:pimeloyl-ACP methyl ester carboxylesterase